MSGRDDDKRARPPGGEPAPAAARAPLVDPRERARRRLTALKGGAAFLVSAAVSPVCAGCDPVPSPPPGFPATVCSPDTEDVSVWFFTSVQAGSPIVVTFSLNAGRTGLELADVFTVTGGALAGDPQFDAASLALSRNVTLNINPDEGATDVTIDTGVSCDDDARAVRISFNLDGLDQNGFLSPAPEDVTP